MRKFHEKAQSIADSNGRPGGFGARLSLATRLNLMLAMASGLILVIGFFFGIHNARRSVADESNAAVGLAFQLIEAGIAERDASGVALEPWLDQLGRLEQTRHLRIRVADAATRHDRAPAQAVESAAPAWFRHMLRPEPAIAEKTLARADGRWVTIRVAADAAAEIDEAWRENQSFYVLIVSIALTVYLLVHFGVRHAFRPMADVLKGFAAIERGDFQQRLPLFPLPEFQIIARAFNHMAATLDASRAEIRALTQQTLSIQEDERRHLARELHDELGQSLTAIKVLAATLPQLDDTRNNAARQIGELCDRLFGVVRGMMRRLRPGLLDDLGLCASLEDLAGNWRELHPLLNVDLRCDPAVDARCELAGIHLYRIVQECLTNAVRHAGASRVMIDLTVARTAKAGEQLTLTVSDNGSGMTDPPVPGLGLAGIRERVTSLGGQFDLDSLPGAGVVVRVQVPCDPP